MSSDSSESSTGSDYDLDVVPYRLQKDKIKQFYTNHTEYKKIKEDDMIYWITKEPRMVDPEYIVPFNEIPFKVQWIDHNIGLLQVEYGHFGWEINIYEIFLEEPSWEDIVARKLELKL
tara:strand:+ start:1218 stop:1571 length:354 start_codon:yes stop_codon:yes gene_type:complete